MKIKKRNIICLMLFVVFLSCVFYSACQRPIETKKVNTNEKHLIDHKNLGTSAVNNSDIIHSIFEYKIEDYNNNSYYSQVYEPSLQATYYALRILNSIGKLHTVDKTTIVNYILSHYDSDLHRFMDSLSFRYLNTDVSRDWIYPYSSALQSTCYATLSLTLLDALSYINPQDVVDYIWDCYNTETSGFIGRPFDSQLPNLFKTATMDNTYFAVITLDLLMDDWLMYISQKNDIIQFVNDLQIEGDSWMTGGFFNDYDTSFDSLAPLSEPNLLSSFYSIRTLEVFGLEDTINIPDFHKFLNNSYNSQLNYFNIGPWQIPEDQCNIVGTALGLDLSDTMEYTDIDRSAVINFILNNRNSLGCWDQSTTIGHHELIDSFQIIRSLENSEEIAQFSLTERNEIGNATNFYVQEQGYSLLSKDYTSMNLINSIVRSFELYGKLADLNIQSLYTQIKATYSENYQDLYTNSFLGYLEKSEDVTGLRSYPIEYYSNKSMLRSHRTIYYGLDSLNRMFKLDDFLFEIDGNELVSDIVATQFLNDTYFETYGAFTPLWPYNSYYSSAFLNSKITFEYSYYAIKCLELLTDELGLGNMTSLGVDTLALYNHIQRNIEETPTELYYEPSFAAEIETTIEYTYYMIYILKTLNMYAEDSQKIINFVEAHLDYENIQNIYFSYKISELLNIEIDFNRWATQELVQEVYSEYYKEFYPTTSRQVIAHENFYYICEMARNSEIGIEASYPSSVDLGVYNHIIVSLDNMILHNFGDYITFKFDCNQLGTHLFTEQPNGTHVLDILIPYETQYYPYIDGYLRAYEGSLIKAEEYISFNTTYTLVYDHVIYANQSTMNFLFNLNASISCNKTCHGLDSGFAFMHAYANDTAIGSYDYTHQNFTHYSLFTLDLPYQNATEYLFQVFLNDGINTTTRFLEEQKYNTTIIKPPEPDPDPDPDPDPPPDPDDPDPPPDPDPDPDDPDDPTDPDDPNPPPDDPDDPDDPETPDSSLKYTSDIQTAIPLMLISIATPGIALFTNQKLKKKHELNP